VGSAGVCRYPWWVQWNAASDNTGESREGVGVGSIERGAANGRCRWPDCSRRARGELTVLKEGVGGVGGIGVACVRVRVRCVCMSLPCVSASESLSRSLSQAGWLATGRADV